MNIDIGPVPDWLVIDAVRYAVGRTSTQPDTTARWLVEAWGKLPVEVRKIVRRDLEEAFARDDHARRLGCTQADGLPLGWDCDRKSWEMVRDVWDIWEE